MNDTNTGVDMTTSEGSWHGIFTIPQTPFAESGLLDTEVLRKEIDFCVDAGTHGIVFPVMVSEFWQLSDDERKLSIKTVVDQTRGRVPVIAGVAGVSTEVAVMFSRYANDVGADGAIALPPYVIKPDLDGLVAYYKAVSDAMDGPIFIQNFDPPLGSSLSPEFIKRLITETPNIKYVKEEMMPCGHSVSALLKECEGVLSGVFTGFSGRWFIDELNRGAAGTMPACQFTDVMVTLYERYRKGEIEGARKIHTAVLPLLNMEQLHGVVFCKEILKRRGIFTSTKSRCPGGLDAFDLKEIDRLLDDVEEWFRI